MLEPTWARSPAVGSILINPQAFLACCMPVRLLFLLGSMQNLDSDLKQALLDTLCGSWKLRKATLDRVFVEDAQFW